MSSRLLKKRLYEDREQTGDVVFIVDTERIHAHKCILAALSPKYKTQFYGSHPDTGDVLVTDISAPAFKEYIQFFYGRTVKFTSENILQILNLAKECLVDHLLKACSTFLLESLSDNNVCWTYRLAILYDLKFLRISCEVRIRSMVPRMFKNADFLRCEQNVLIEILKIDPINCEEWDILKGCIGWAQYSCERNRLSTKVAANLRTALGPAITEIRFNSLSIEQFAKFNSMYKGFFSLEEFREITNIIANLKPFKSTKFNQRSRKRPPPSDISSSESSSSEEMLSTSEESDTSSDSD